MKNSLKNGKTKLITARLDHHKARIYNLPVIPGTNKNEIQATEQKHPTEWESWARQLNHWGLTAFAATLLESGGAFATLAAQTLYISQPLVDPWASPTRLSRVASLLENPEQGLAFANFLRERAR